MMGRSPCCSKVGLNRGAWTASEDKILTDYIKLHGEGKWRNLPKIAGLKRCGKSCRLRWLNYLRPDIKRGNISQDEEELIIRLHKLLGNRWSLIAGRLPGRTDNEIKNYWNTNLGKRLQDSRGNNNNTPVSNPKHSADYETFEKCKKKTKKIKAAQTDSNVVRTKALRCSKSFFTPQPQRVEHIDQLHRVPEKPKDVVNESPNAKPASESSGSPCWDSSFYPNQDNSPNFILNVDLGETVSLSDLFGSDFMGGVYDSGSEIITNRNESNEMSTSNSSFDEPPHFSKEMLDHFSSIPEFWGDWLA